MKLELLLGIQIQPNSNVYTHWVSLHFYKLQAQTSMFLLGFDVLQSLIVNWKQHSISDTLNEIQYSWLPLKVSYLEGKAISFA